MDMNSVFAPDEALSVIGMLEALESFADRNTARDINTGHHLRYDIVAALDMLAEYINTPERADAAVSYAVEKRWRHIIELTVIDIYTSGISLGRSTREPIDLFGWFGVDRRRELVEFLSRYMGTRSQGLSDHWSYGRHGENRRLLDRETIEWLLARTVSGMAFESGIASTTADQRRLLADDAVSLLLRGNSWDLSRLAAAQLRVTPDIEDWLPSIWSPGLDYLVENLEAGKDKSRAWTLLREYKNRDVLLDSWPGITRLLGFADDRADPIVDATLERVPLERLVDIMLSDFETLSFSTSDFVQWCETIEREAGLDYLATWGPWVEMSDVIALLCNREQAKAEILVRYIPGAAAAVLDCWEPRGLHVWLESRIEALGCDPGVARMLLSEHRDTPLSKLEPVLASLAVADRKE